MESSDNMSREQIEQSSPFSWWWDTHNRPPHSQWLHSTLAELDNKIKMMLELIEDNGDTFAKRAEMYYEKRPQLIKMVQDLHTSYRALADKYDLLKSESSIKASNNGSFSNSFRKGHPQSIQNNPTIIEQPNFSSESDSSMSEVPSATNSMSIHSSNELMKNEDDRDYEKTNDFKVHGLAMKEEVWNEVQMSKFCELFEENLCKQVELIRKNDEKRKVINELRNENKILSQKLGDGSMREKQKHKRKLRGFFCLA
ncbi:hypothetical protein BUALT_Bualt17G0010600 [Buddleja alternifolia]|uniref:NAB domain-containing protein n=1 Tax=Buddleja alternifolia TaxID=168488 RepID=A0AAV6WAS3_9LAMI|nr:hypothetical protein BUALT_Bualt17G0010600 [Buddleja alternifolia]